MGNLGLVAERLSHVADRLARTVDSWEDGAPNRRYRAVRAGPRGSPRPYGMITCWQCGNRVTFAPTAQIFVEMECRETVVDRHGGPRRRSVCKYWSGGVPPSAQRGGRFVGVRSGRVPDQ